MRKHYRDAMFDVGAPELLVLIVIAVILFGPEKLPEFARKAARVVRYLRNMAGNAQQQLSKELGPGFEDVDVRDLNPKTFIQKHLLDDVEPVIADVKKEITAAKTLGGDAADDVTAAVNGATASGNGSKAVPRSARTAPPRRRGRARSPRTTPTRPSGRAVSSSAVRNAAGCLIAATGSPNLSHPLILSPASLDPQVSVRAAARPGRDPVWPGRRRPRRELGPPGCPESN